MTECLGGGIASEALIGSLVMSLVEDGSRGKKLVDKLHTGYLFRSGKR